MTDKAFGRTRIGLGLGCLVVVAGSAGCGSMEPGDTLVAQVADSGASYWPGATWRTAAPRAVGIDTARLSSGLRAAAAGQYGSLDAILIVRFGWLVEERYFGWSPTAPHTMQSVTKSVASLLYGIATAGGTMAEGRLDRPVVELFARFTPAGGHDPRKRALTVDHLLTMRTSMDFWEQPYPGSPLDVLNRSTDDWTRLILDRPMTGEPGTAWAYNSGAAILIGSAIRELTGEAVDAFARRELFGPLGVIGESWVRSPFDRLPHLGGGLSLRPTDLARIGYLVLRHGAWDGREIVPRGWIEASTRAATRGPPVFFSGYGSGYGRFWWLFPVTRGGNDEGVIAASGAGGQWLFIVPTLDLVVAIAAQNGNGLDLFYDRILPSLTR
jgi:CubicO group peptidase (beta-lactamase class C family)